MASTVDAEPPSLFIVQAFANASTQKKEKIGVRVGFTFIP